ncbi:MAG: O-antigen ligase family protein [Flavobacteriaceae bacterium]|nr:O-antigen ligase family protein [Flavobacteriaceae bacterium]
MNYNLKEILQKGTIFFFLFFGIYILFPSENRAWLFFPMAAMGLFNLLLYRKVKWNRLIILNSALYIIYCLGFLFLSEDRSSAKILETSAAVIVCPLLFAIFAANQKKVFSERVQALFFRVVIYSCVLYAIIIFAYLVYSGILWDSKPFGFYVTQLTKNIPLIYDHPIYTSLALSIALLFSVSIASRKSGNKRIKKQMLVLMIPLVLALIFLSRRGVILAFGISMIIFLTGAFSKLKLRPYHIVLSAIGVIALVFINPTSRDRMSEIFNFETYVEKNETNSTNNRIQVYKCAVEQIAKRPWFGYGINDDKTALYSCYKKSLYYLYENRFNTHNQYLSIAMKSGIIGLLIFILFLAINLRLAIRTNDMLFLSVLILFIVIMLFENILERQNGVMIFSVLINYFGFKNLLKLERTYCDNLEMESELE